MEVAAADPTMAQLVLVLTEREDELVAEGIRRIREIPEYARVTDEAFWADVDRHVTEHHEALVRSIARGRALDRDEMSFIRPRASRRVGRIPLTAFLRGFRTYMELLWEAVLETGVDERSKDSALRAVGIIIRYIDIATTEAAEVFLEGERLQSAQGEALRRDLVEDLVAGVAPAPGPKLAAARGAGLVDGAHVVVVAASPMGEPAEDHRLRSAASAIGRTFGSAVEPLTVVRQGDVLCIAPAPPAGELAAALTRTQQRLSADGIVLAIGVSAEAGLAGLPDAYGEASAAVERLRPSGGVLALEQLSAFDCLAMFGREVARRRTAPALRRFVAEDRADGSVLIATLRAYAEADFNVKVAAAQLFVHPNTARYRLAKIEERTGLDLRRFADVQELLIAVRVEELVSAAP
jgi:sugar diacid utilization regulator